MLQYFHAFAIFYDPHAVVDGRDLIAQCGLDGGDIVYSSTRWRPRLQAVRPNTTASVSATTKRARCDKRKGFTIFTKDD